ncbi:RagB/SusD family nutrient uptake outer membrane protein [Sphingobacterium pedocola]|uniref:RagB/SusD family nutrient uptake outer membrane protein n=1 Tax=Sphingobacterium pedocola TaxID=2082722 RepID=A0ABR9T9S2_9SPHI|nr:RagB/SusD family nutrient uptake outer membrane protein [Sphingobacterium pedocola]MBE8721849.1 RagB/SusD family nutrient uptake outer membrane protein [Sphingobacterium pedocola]
MKKIIVYIVSIGISYFALGCKNDPLDITPDGRITMEDVWKDAIRTEAFLNTVYQFVPGYFMSYGYFETISGLSDESYYKEGIGIAWANGSLSPNNNFVNDFYNNCWSGIRYANVFIENIDRAQVTNENNRGLFKAEAKILRAFYYLELIKQYGPMPVIDKEIAVDFNFTSLKRPTFQENVDFIVRDLDDALAESRLPIRITVGSQGGRVTRAIAHAIKSQALLYNASPLWNSQDAANPEGDISKWAAAAQASKEAIQELTKNDEYKLYSNYGDYFLRGYDVVPQPQDRETIMETGGGSRTHFITMNNIPSKTGVDRAGATPTQELVDSYDMQATGLPAILGYNDANHLDPIISTASGYNENAPYVGRDPRFYASIWYNGASYDNIRGNIHTVETFTGGADQMLRTEVNANTGTGYYLRKFIDPMIQVSERSNASFKKYRLAEIYLNFAEAANEAGVDISLAYEAINTVRRRADMPDIAAGLTKEEFRDRIRRERRVELFLEEHRFWDVRRWKIIDQVDKLVTGMEITQVSPNNYVYTRFVVQRRASWQDKYLIFPLPSSELSNVPDFSDNQNPGW